MLLMLLGGGSFGNEIEWIFAAIRQALAKVVLFDLDIRIVNYGPPSRELVTLVENLSGRT